MGYCSNPHCPDVKIGALSRVHSFLCSKSSLYHSWHHHPHHKKVHLGSLAVYTLAVFGLVLFNIFAYKTHAATATNWDMNTASDYTYNNSEIDFSGGVAQLKTAGTPGTDWIATDSGHNWSYRKKITFDNSTQNADLTDFPVLIKLDKDSDIDYSKTQNLGQDIRFTDSDGATSLKYEIEKWDESGTSYVWVKVPKIDQSSATDNIYMYYGNTGALDGQDGPSVWDNGFLGVWHLDESGTIVHDSTTNNKDGSKTADGHPSPITGQIYNGQNFLGDDRVGTNINNALTDFTTEVWFKDNGVSDNGGYERLADKSYTGCFMLMRNGTTANSWGGGVRETSPPYGVFVTLTDGQWHQISSVRSGTTHYVYGDGGAVSNSNTVSGSACDNTTFSIGAWGDGASTQQRFGGVIDEVRISNIARSQQWLAASYKSGKDTFNTFGSESSFFPSDSPTITSNTGQGYSSLSGFTQTLGSGSTGTIKYQISPDNGSTWYWWNGSSWASTSSGYTEATLSTDINSHIASFTAGSNPKTFKWKAYLNSNGSEQPQLDNIALDYVWDTGAPNNVSAFTSAKSQASGGVDLTVSDGSRWYNYPNPYFDWVNPGDTANGGETASGISTYYICFNTNNTCHPVNEGVSQPDTAYTANNLVSGNTYYFRVRTKDNAGNYSAGENQLFTYKYDGDKPNNPQYISASPSGYSNTKDFSFIWPTANSAAASDTGGSSLKGYQYKINNDNHWYGASHTGTEDDVIPSGTGTIALTGADQSLVTDGTNTFYLRTLDNAGNISSSTIQVPFYYNNSAPPPPTVINVNPVTNTVNSFSFSWSAPENWPGGIAKYYYSFNHPPNSNSAYTTETHIDNQAAATVQGENIIYVVAEDNAGNIAWGNYRNASFYANTPAPGLPTNLLVSDQSIRGTAYKTSLSWVAPTEVGIGVHHYNIYRKNGSGDYAKIASPTDRYYLDESVQAGTGYSYKVKAVDSADKESADSTVVQITPRGRYNSPARIVDGSIKTDVTSRTAVISWQTETDRDPQTNEIHTTDSMVAYGKTRNLEATAADRTFAYNHALNLKNLEPDTIYYYQVLGVDENGNRTESSISTFQTQKPTVISKVEAIDIRQTTAILKWESSRITTTELFYGKSTSYGAVYKEGDIPSATSHTIFLKDLDPGTQYHFQIQGKDEFGDVIKSDDYTLLKTLEFPKIQNVTFQPLTNEAITTIEVNWTTNIPTDGRVRYASTDGSDWREEYDGAFKTDHKFKIGGGKLLDKKTYLFKALVRDQYGNEATSENQSYTTPEDTRPPVITNLQAEVSVEGSGETAQVSAVVTWDTDEPADSQVSYGEGTSGDFSNSTGKDTAPAMSHLVVISNLKAAQTYHVKAKSADKSGNLSQSNSQNFVTNQASQSVISIILTRLQQVFGWMGSINGIFGG